MRIAALPFLKKFIVTHKHIKNVKKNEYKTYFVLK